ncbi:Thioredoxin [Caenorhabditis elegans]|nr:Thioredoxin [Caenorhabditis elegans]CCD31024.1 Thioredoxin [Caenorhabditis elegans]|eukprot:NP_001256208.1 Thioredoxin [Caenorhabditis elegans]
MTQLRHFSHGASVFDIDSVEDFTEKVIQSSVPVIVDFHAEWCGPCQALGPRLEEKVNGRQGSVLLAKINVDHAGELAMDYGISAVPTVFAFKNGEKISGFSGVLDDEQLDDFIEDVLAA